MFASANALGSFAVTASPIRIPRSEAKASADPFSMAWRPSTWFFTGTVLTVTNSSFRNFVRDVSVVVPGMTAIRLSASSAVVRGLSRFRQKTTPVDKGHETEIHTLLPCQGCRGRSAFDIDFPGCDHIEPVFGGDLNPVQFDIGPELLLNATGDFRAKINGITNGLLSGRETRRAERKPGSPD